MRVTFGSGVCMRRKCVIAGIRYHIPYLRLYRVDTTMFICFELDIVQWPSIFMLRSRLDSAGYMHAAQLCNVSPIFVFVLSWTWTTKMPDAVCLA